MSDSVSSAHTASTTTPTGLSLKKTPYVLKSQSVKVKNTYSVLSDLNEDVESAILKQKNERNPFQQLQRKVKKSYFKNPSESLLPGSKSILTLTHNQISSTPSLISDAEDYEIL